MEVIKVMQGVEKVIKLIQLIKGIQRVDNLFGSQFSSLALALRVATT
jgi:hypothetical protein